MVSKDYGLSNEDKKIILRWFGVMHDWATRLDVPKRHFESFCIGIWIMYDLLNALRDDGFMTQQEVDEFGPKAVNTVANAFKSQKQPSEQMEWLEWFNKLWEGKSCQDKP